MIFSSVVAKPACGIGRIETIRSSRFNPSSSTFKSDGTGTSVASMAPRCVAIIRSLVEFNGTIMVFAPIMIFLDKHPNLIGRQSAKTPGADPFAGEMAHRQDFRPAHQHCWSFTEVKQITFSGKPRAPAVARWESSLTASSRQFIL
ncbi:MAG: hypothetical protein ACXW4O_14190 [Candidatus Binatia bacterium]